MTQKRGRPSLYKDEFIHQAKALCWHGATDMEMAEYFGVALQTFNRWKAEKQDFRDALKQDKDIADKRVERSLYQKAVGYSHEDTDIRVIDGQIVTTSLIKHYPPDTTACIFWLKNRKKDEWRQVVNDEQGDGGNVVYNSPSHDRSVDDSRENGPGDL